MDMIDTMKELTIEEKISLLTGKNLWETADIERLGIESIAVSDGPHGVRKEQVDASGLRSTIKSVCFPTASAMAATWNTDLIRGIGAALGEECGAMDVDVLLGPAVNIKRTPLCGRNFEYFSEDPLLAGELAAAYIQGVQSKGVGTALKHFAANNQEYDRGYISSEVDIRALREIYLKPFEIAVKKSNPWMLMCAYNRLNGVYCSENKFLLHDILRDDWNYEGVVISDWGAVHNKVNSLKASLDLEMPNNSVNKDILIEAYHSGLVREQDIDSALERILKIIGQACDLRKTRAGKHDEQAHDQLVKQASLEAITLLKNENNILPISKDKVKKLAIIGEYAKQPIIQGGGSSHVEPESVENAYDSILKLAEEEISVEFAPGYLYFSWGDCPDNLGMALKAANAADAVVIFVGNRSSIESEAYDRATIRLPLYMEDIILKIASRNPNVAVVVQAGSAIDMSAWINHVKAVVFSWYGGQMAGSALAEVLFGLSCPCGKTAETFPLRIEDTPSFPTYPGNGFSSWYSEGIMVGYRHYDACRKDVLFPFGHGLSYTSFEYSDLQVIYDHAAGEDVVTTTFKLKNTGNCFGKEIVQLYVRDESPKVLKAEKELKAFDKIPLAAGEEKVVRLKLDRNAFSYFSLTHNSWHVDAGEYSILIGASSRDIRLKSTVCIP